MILIALIIGIGAGIWINKNGAVTVIVHDKVEKLKAYFRK